MVRGEHCGRVWIQNENLKNRSWNRSVVKIRKKKKKEKERKKKKLQIWSVRVPQKSTKLKPLPCTNPSVSILNPSVSILKPCVWSETC